MARGEFRRLLGLFTASPGRRLLLNELPGSLDMARLSVGLADAQAQRQLAIEFGMRQEKISALIQPVHDGLIGCITCLVAEAHEIQRNWRCQFEAIVVADPFCEILG